MVAGEGLITLDGTASGVSVGGVGGLATIGVGVTVAVTGQHS